jgi:hypothetical protein
MPNDSPRVRYDVFLSSTWNDFKEVRPLITEALQKEGFVPRGMEQFPAMTDEVFEYIKKVINECSYYVVASGSRYGSISPRYRKSYTHLEFDYAMSVGIRPLCFLLEEEKLRSSMDTIPPDLAEFRKIMMTDRSVSFFRDQKDLPLNIVHALTDRFLASPRTVWVNLNDSDLQNLTRVKAEGLTHFDGDSNAVDQTDALRESRNVFAMLNDAYGWARKYESILEERFSNSGKRTTIVLLDPEAPFIPSIAQRSNKVLDEQVRDIWDSVERLVSGSGNEAYKSGRLHVLGCQQPISGCYFIFDDRFIWNPYLTRYRPPQLPRLELSKPGGRVREMLLTDAEVIERELRANKNGDLVARVLERRQQNTVPPQ